MRLLRKWTIPVVLAATAVVLGAGTATAAPLDDSYYVSLGDSLSVGAQPNAAGDTLATRQGYDHDLAHTLDLRLVELGCLGETTTTMIKGGICAYPQAKSQLQAAVNFLEAHRGHVRLVTVTVGANDLENCASATGIDATCVANGLAAVQTNLKTIADTLRLADPSVATRFVGLNEYDPNLATFLLGPAGQALARRSEGIVDNLDQIQAADYRQAGFGVADVETAYRTDQFSPTVPFEGMSLPTNVATICQLTFMCAPAPVGPNIHPNATGYSVIAAAIRKAL
jgi:lysophospholipase L1-like esterase